MGRHPPPWEPASMSNVLIFPPSDCALERIDDRRELIEFDAKRTEIQTAMQDVSELRAKAKLGLDNAIASLEQGHARLRKVTQILGDHPVQTKLQGDLRLLEQLLAQAKASLAGLWSRCA